MNYQEYLLEIAHCPIARGIYKDPKQSESCKEIVEQQSGASVFQLPEPWSGRLDRAPLLFISSNPSINLDEIYPHERWPDACLVDFFHERFTSNEEWVNTRRQTRLVNGGRSRGVAFWGACKARAREIWSHRDITPGEDFALTEVVHCKSTKEKGVRSAVGQCVKKYLDSTLDLAAAHVLIVFGKIAEQVIRQRTDLQDVDLSDNLRKGKIGGKHRLVVFLPHPNARGKNKGLKDNIGENGISYIQKYLDDMDRQ